MTEKTNLFPNLIRFRETNRLKMAIAASIMLWCATPQQAAADTYEKHEIASVQQQKVKTTGTVLDLSLIHIYVCKTVTTPTNFSVIC